MVFDLDFPKDYSKFYIHKGVKNILSFITSTLQNEKFILINVLGFPRAGKTSLSYKILDISSQKIGILSKSFFNSTNFDLNHYIDLKVIIIDDFSSIDNISKFVDLYNFCKTNSIILILISDEFNQDDANISSRINSGIMFKIDHPDSEDLIGLFKLIGKQFGITLKQEIIDNIIKQIPCSIKSIENFYSKLNSIINKTNKKISSSLITLALKDLI